MQNNLGNVSTDAWNWDSLSMKRIRANIVASLFTFARHYTSISRTLKSKKHLLRYWTTLQLSNIMREVI